LEIGGKWGVEVATSFGFDHQTYADKSSTFNFDDDTEEVKQNIKQQGSTQDWGVKTDTYAGKSFRREIIKSVSALMLFF
jgi:hypothetical protein